MAIFSHLFTSIKIVVEFELLALILINLNTQLMFFLLNPSKYQRSEVRIQNTDYRGQITDGKEQMSEGR